MASVNGKGLVASSVSAKNECPGTREGSSIKSACVIIVNYNSGALLAECVRALLQSTIPTDIYVSDNGSSDDSLDRLRLAIDAHTRVTVVENHANLGFAGGNNVILARCKSDYVLLLNPDAIPAPDWVERMVSAANNYPEYASFASRMIKMDSPDRLDGAGDSYHAGGFVWRRGDNLPNSRLFDATVEVFSACAAAALYRREAIEKVNGFDEDFFCYLEDIDLGFRMRLAGFKCLYVPEAVVYHIGSAMTGKDSDFSVYHGHRNVVWTYVKNMPTFLFWVCLPIHIAANLYVITRYALIGRGRVLLRAKRDAIKGLPKMWRKRREIQARRVSSVQDIWKVLSKGRPRRRR